MLRLKYVSSSDEIARANTIQVHALTITRYDVIVDTYVNDVLIKKNKK